MMYKIRDADGNYSRGGIYKSFGKNGKVWATKGYIHNHLRMLGKTYNWGVDRYEDCILEEIDTVNMVKTETPMPEFIEDYLKGI